MLRDARAQWRGAPFTVGDDWPLPRVCRLARERLEEQQVRLARVWALAGLHAEDHEVLDWIRQDERLWAVLHADPDVWMLGFVAALAEGASTQAEILLEERRRESRYDSVTRAFQLLELSERGVVVCSSVGPRTVADVPAGPHLDALASYIASVPGGGAADPLHIVGGGGPARARMVEDLRRMAAGADVRIVHGTGDATDDLSPWRVLLRDIWAIGLRDRQFDLDAHNAVLSDLVVNPRPTGGRSSATPLVGTAVAVILKLVRRRPALVVIDEVDRLTPAAAALLDEVRAQLRGARVGFVFAGADLGAVGGPATLVKVPTPLGRSAEAAGRDIPGRWLAAAAVTALDEEIDPVVVARVLGIHPEQADEGLTAAVRRGVVALRDGVRFTSVHVREQALTELATSPPQARRLYRAAFEELSTRPARDGAASARLARHALAARPELPDGVVAKACLAAATAERAARRHDAAIEFAMRGLALTDDGELRFNLQMVQGDSRRDRADMRAAATTYRAAYDEAAGSERRRAIAAVRLARRWSDPGRVDPSLLRVLEESREALAGASDLADRELYMQLNGHLAHKSTMALAPPSPADTLPLGVELARTTMAALSPTTTPGVACEVLTECRWALFDYAAPQEIRAISARLEGVSVDARSDHFQGEALIATVIDHIRIGDLAAAHHASERHRDHVARTNHSLDKWLRATLDTAFDLWEGDLAAAEDRIGSYQPILEEARRSDLSDSLQQTWMGQVFWLRREQGRMSELLTDDGIGRQAERRQYFPVWTAGMALLRSEVGQPGAAADQIAALLRQTHDLRTLPPHGWAVPTLALLAEAVDSLMRHGRGVRFDIMGLAQRVDALLAPHNGELVLAGWPTVLLGPVARARGLLALACGDVDGALAHVDEGIRAVGTARAQLAWLRYHRARTLLTRRSRRWTDEARDLLDEARATAVSSGMGALAVAASALLARMDETGAGPDTR